MRYLRMFSNAIVSGGLGAAYLGVVFLQLNPGVPLFPINLLPLLVTLSVAYGIHLSALFYAAMVLREILAFDRFSPGWLSLRTLSWLFTLDAAGAAALMWLNLGSYGPVLAPDAARRMAMGAVVVTGCAVVFLFVGVFRYSFGRRRGALGSSVLVLTLAVSLTLPLVLRGPGVSTPLASRLLDLDIGLAPPAPGPRILLILLDGASLDFVSSAALEGKLPNFGKILDSGAAMHLATVRPTHPGPVWTTVATGRLPWKTGVRSAALYGVPAAPDHLELLPDGCFAHGLVRLGFLDTASHSAASLRVRPLWSILSSAGVSVGVVNWPLTHPVQPTRGYLVSDQFYRPGDQSLEPDDPTAIYPAEALATARAAGDAVIQEPLGRMQAFQLPRWDALADMLPRQTSLLDRMYDRISRTLQARSRPRFATVRFRGLDVAGHVFLRFALPREFGDVTADERRKYGRVLEGAYVGVDDMVGLALASLESDDLLLVVSGFGMEPMSVGKRMLERAVGNPHVSGSHENAPDGFLLAYGRAVSPGRKRRASVVDVTPTVLYFLGLPVARDMDGYARTDLFRREFTDGLPLTFIPTYER